MARTETEEKFIIDLDFSCSVTKTEAQLREQVAANFPSVLVTVMEDPNDPDRLICRSIFINEDSLDQFNKKLIPLLVKAGLRDRNALISKETALRKRPEDLDRKIRRALMKESQPKL